MTNDNNNNIESTSGRETNDPMLRHMENHTDACDVAYDGGAVFCICDDDDNTESTLNETPMQFLGRAGLLPTDLLDSLTEGIDFEGLFADDDDDDDDDDDNKRGIMWALRNGYGFTALALVSAVVGIVLLALGIV